MLSGRQVGDVEFGDTVVDIKTRRESSGFVGDGSLSPADDRMS